MMDEETGGTFIVLEDEEGNSAELEIIAELEYDGETYTAFLPADMDEDDPDYGYVILKNNVDEEGFEVYDTIDDERKEEEIYERFMALLYEEEDEEDPKQ
ncbi:MAG: DUF1292 domain-containing protein [Oscillospiraceae bacterium]|nr:DUF1292 domain-containing protein [Oscillospiraceae bacterium]